MVTLVALSLLKYVFLLQLRSQSFQLFLLWTVSSARSLMVQNLWHWYEKLALIPETKLVITNSSSSVIEKEEIPHETLQLYSPRRIVLATLSELLNKRWQTMDLVSVMLELKRTFVTRGETILHGEEDLSFLFVDDYSQAKMDENLSCLPRLQKTELIDRDK